MTDDGVDIAGRVDRERAPEPVVVITMDLETLIAFDGLDPVALAG